jgi:threonine/homoserine/homoserine lactone efflux protein
MSPGPSLAVICSLTLNNGRLAGIIAAVSHGLAITGFALLTALGLVVLLGRYETAFNLLQLVGCLYLIWMATMLLFTAPKQAPDQSSDIRVLVAGSKWAAARDGFVIALINPKIIFFFSARFSQFVSADSALWVKLVMAAIAGTVDIIWYMLVAIVISQPTTLLKYQQSGPWLNKVFGLLLLIIVAGFFADLVVQTVM